MRALVTGGAKRLGREISTYLASRGYDVAVHYNNSESEAVDVTKEINSLGRISCLLYTSPSPRDVVPSRMPSSA